MKYNQRKYHLLFWLLYLILEINLEFAWMKFDFSSWPWVKRLQISSLTELIFLSIKIPLGYSLLRLFATTKLNKTNKFFISILLISVAIFFHRILVHDFFWSILYHIKPVYERWATIVLLNAFMDLLFVIALVFGLDRILKQIQLKEEIAVLKSNQLAQELKFLKTQINPHFLFNTLNNIYGLALKKSDDTPEIILKLAKIMRYNIYESANEEVALIKEIENIEDFIAIHQLRHSKLDLNFQYKIDNTNQVIAPLILIQFIENAFKHGVSESVSKAKIAIDLELFNSVLTFKVINSKEIKTSVDSTKIGLKNIERQLQLLYPDYELSINEDDLTFSVYLVLKFS